MNIVLFAPHEISAPLALSDSRAQHIRGVLHKKAGDTFAAGIENGQAGSARIDRIDEQAGLLYFSFTAQTDGGHLYPLSFIVGFPRPIQLKRLFRDVAGLGVRELHLCGTELGEKSYMQTTLITRGAAHDLLREGSIQAKSTHVPELYTHESLASCLSALSGEDRLAHAGALAALDNVRPRVSFPAFLGAKAQTELNRRGVWAAVGSERGWTDGERALLESHGFVRCSLGQRVLRTETAVTAAAAIALAAMGILL